MTVSVPEKTRRVQMELSPGSFERLNRLKDLSEAASYTEVMKDALRLYEYFIEQDINGSKFIVETKDGKTSEIKIFA
jgi:hypothetical protein